MAEHDSWEKEEDLGNIKEVIADFKGRMSTEVRRQERLESEEEKDFRRAEFSRKYMTKLLYGWEDEKFKKEYLKKLERNWQN